MAPCKYHFFWNWCPSLHECDSQSLCLVNNDICICQTAKTVRESYDTLVDIFKCIENFMSRLKIYTEINTTAMVETMVKIMVELLAVLALATKQINQGRLSTSCSIFSDDNQWF